MCEFDHFHALELSYEEIGLGSKETSYLAKFVECIDFPASSAFWKGSDIVEFTKFSETQKKP